MRKYTHRRQTFTNWIFDSWFTHLPQWSYTTCGDVMTSYTTCGDVLTLTYNAQYRYCRTPLPIKVNDLGGHWHQFHRNQKCVQHLKLPRTVIQNSPVPAQWVWFYTKKRSTCVVPHNVFFVLTFPLNAEFTTLQWLIWSYANLHVNKNSMHLEFLDK